MKSPDGRFVLQIPAGALSATTEIVVTQIADPSAFSAAIANMVFPGKLMGPVIAIQSTIDTLRVPAKLTIPYDPTLIPQGASVGELLVVRSCAAGQLEVLSGGDDIESGVVGIDSLTATISTPSRISLSLPLC